MKKSLRRIFLVVQLMLMQLFLSGVFADPPGPPGPGGSPISGGTPVGAPIDDGIGILLALGIAYGCYKIYVIWKRRGALKEAEQV